MTWLDVTVVATVCLSALYGLWKGIVRAVVGIAGLLAAFMIAGAFYRDLAARLWPGGGLWTYAAAYAIVLVAIMLTAAIIAAFLARLIHMTPLGVIDRSLGLVAGLLVAALGWALLFTFVLAAIPGADTFLGDSAIVSALVRLLAGIRGLPTAESAA